MTKDEALKLALEALTNAYWPTDSDLMPAHNIKECADAITAIKEALMSVPDGAQPSVSVEQEPVSWSDLQKQAQQIVESKFVWKRFIDGTPLANGIACWMASFAQQHTTPPPVAEPHKRPSRSDIKPLTDEEIDALSREMVKGNKSVNWVCRAIEAAHGIYAPTERKEKNT